MTDFHVQDDQLDAYLGGRLDRVSGASTDAHLMACPPCRDRLTARSGDSVARTLEDAWERVLAGVEAEPAGRPARFLQAIGIAEPDSVVLRAVAGAASQWTLAAALIMFTAALAAAFGTSAAARLPFLVLAPLWPPLGVAASFRFGARATAPFEATTAYPPARLLLWRTAYVLVTAAPATALFGALIAADRWSAVTWLLPAIACTLAVVIAATWVDPLAPATAIAVVWTSVVVAWHHHEGATAAPSAVGVQAVSLVVAVELGAVLDRRLRTLHLVSTIPREARP